MIVIDDAPWADGPSLQALGFALRRLVNEPVLSVFIARDEDRRHAAGRGRVASFPAKRGLVSVTGLGEADVLALAEATGHFRVPARGGAPAADSHCVATLSTHARCSANWTRACGPPRGPGRCQPRPRSRRWCLDASPTAARRRGRWLLQPRYWACTRSLADAAALAASRDPADASTRRRRQACWRRHCPAANCVSRTPWCTPPSITTWRRAGGPRCTPPPPGGHAARPRRCAIGRSPVSERTSCSRPSWPAFADRAGRPGILGGRRRCLPQCGSRRSRPRGRGPSALGGRVPGAWW